MKKFSTLILFVIFSLICAVPSHAQYSVWGKKTNATIEAEGQERKIPRDSVGFTTIVVNNIMEPSGRDEGLKRLVSTGLNNYQKDELTNCTVLKVWAITDSWTILRDNDDFIQCQYMDFLYAYKEEKNGRCWLFECSLIKKFDYATRTYGHPRFSIGNTSPGSVGFYYKTPEGTKGIAYGSAARPLDCASFVPGTNAAATSAAASPAATGSGSGGNVSPNPANASKPAHTADAAIKEAVKDGPYELKNPNGEVQTSGQYANGKKTGKWSYFTKGQVTREEQYTDGQLNGKKVGYSATGSIEYEENYADGKKDGSYKKYTNGKLWQTGTFTAGKKNGTWTIYDQAGKVTKTEVFVDGLLQK